MLSYLIPAKGRVGAFTRSEAHSRRVSSKQEPNEDLFEIRQQCDEVQNKEEPRPAALHIETMPNVFQTLPKCWSAVNVLKIGVNGIHLHETADQLFSFTVAKEHDCSIPQCTNLI